MNVNQVEAMVWNASCSREAAKVLLDAMGITGNMDDYDMCLNVAKLAYTMGVSDARKGVIKDYEA